MDDLSHAGSISVKRKTVSWSKAEAGIKTYQLRWIKAAIKVCSHSNNSFYCRKSFSFIHSP